jgi:hypothetical protein
MGFQPLYGPLLYMLRQEKKFGGLVIRHKYGILQVVGFLIGKMEMINAFFLQGVMTYTPWMQCPANQYLLLAIKGK